MILKGFPLLWIVPLTMTLVSRTTRSMLSANGSHRLLDILFGLLRGNPFRLSPDFVKDPEILRSLFTIGLVFLRRDHHGHRLSSPLNEDLGVLIKYLLEEFSQTLASFVGLDSL